MKEIYHQNMVETICTTVGIILIVLFISNCTMNFHDNRTKSEMYSECLKSTKDCNKWLE